MSATTTPSLLRFSTMGSVDSGKSTLIGRLLLDSDNVHLDQATSLSAGTSDSEIPGSALALLTDGLAAEREQGITIDVAYRYFSTPERKFILADAPGHEQYTRNMATAASTADLAILVVDASEGLSTQSKRHAFIAALLGVPRFLIAVNKMDTCHFSETIFNQIKTNFLEFAERLSVKNLQCIPVSALTGANVVTRSSEMSWYTGQTVLEYLNQVYVGGDTNSVDFRLPVQCVLRSDNGERRYAGQIVSGSVSVGEEIYVLPAMHKSTVTGFDTASSTTESRATVPQSISITLSDHIDISRGDMIVRAGNIPNVRNTFEAMVVWMHSEPSQQGRPYIIQHTTRSAKAYLDEIQYIVDVEQLSRTPAAPLALNQIGRVRVTTTSPLMFDAYDRNRATGSFILVDSDSHSTVAAGMIIDRLPFEMLEAKSSAKTTTTAPVSKNIRPETSAISRAEREIHFKQKAKTIWLTGLPASGKSTIAAALEQSLFEAGHAVYRLDGDNVRFGLNRDLGFSSADRSENIRRIAEVAKLFNEAGLIAICSFISPFRSDREQARTIIGADAFLEIYVDTPLSVCEQRDPKGLYKKARTGEIQAFTGVSAPYEPPSSPDLRIETTSQSVDEAVRAVIDQVLQASR